MISPLPGKILETYNEGDNRIGLVEFGGKRRAIYLNLVPEAQVGDYVRFRAGFATECVNMEESEASVEQPGKRAEEDREPDLRSNQAYRFLSELDSRQLRKLLPLAQDKQFDAGEIIFHSGDRSLFLHLIVSGDVALEETSGHQPMLVQTLHAGDGMGWSALTPSARTHFQARAESKVSTVAFSGDQLHAACERDPSLGYALTRRLLELVTDRLDVVRIRLASSGRVSHAGEYHG
jgi:CRP/FNR family cyclic AMP-dependent transcriptional regulator